MGIRPRRSSADLGRVLVDADDVVAVLGEAGAGDQPDIAGPDNRDLHARDSWMQAARALS